MDLSDALFSPSKARQQQAQAKDWIFVDSWLSKKYHPKPVPAFERNEDTLQALMTLVAFNERADEEQALVERVEREAFRELQEKTYDTLDEEIYKTVETHLSKHSQASLHTQAEASILLQSPTTAPSALASRITSLTAHAFDLAQQEARLATLHATLGREHRRVEETLQTLRSEIFAPGGDNSNSNNNSHSGSSLQMQRETATWARDVKMLQLKLDEYNERLAQYNQMPAPHPNREEVASRQAELDALKSRLRDVNARIEGFQGLPPDIGEARRVLEAMKGELRVLVDRRDEGFEGLVEEGAGGRSRLPIRRG